MVGGIAGELAKKVAIAAGAAKATCVAALVGVTLQSANKRSLCPVIVAIIA